MAAVVVFCDDRHDSAAEAAVAVDNRDVYHVHSVAVVVAVYGEMRVFDTLLHL